MGADLQRIELHFALEEGSSPPPERTFLAPMVYGALLTQLHHDYWELFDFLHHEGSGSGFRPWRLAVQRPSATLLVIQLTGLTADACGQLRTLVAQGLAGLSLQEGRWQYRFTHAVAKAGCSVLSLLQPPSASPCTAWRLHFASPTTFKDKDLQYCPFPMPDKVLSHLFQRIEALHPAISLEAASFLKPVYEASRVRMERMEGQLIQVQQAHIPTFTGGLRWQCKPKQAEEAALLGLLWRFAAYSGLGAKTTQGLGDVRIVEERRSSHFSQSV